MGSIVNLFVKFSGLGWVWNVVDGYKTILTGSISVLTGLLGLLQELQGPLLSHNAGGLLALAKGLPHDNSWLLIVSGIGMMTIRHAIAKPAAPSA